MPREAVRNLNLNLPPVGSSSLTGAEIITVEPEPMVEDSQPVVADKSKKAVKFQKPDADQELKFPINDSLLVGNGASTSVGSSSAPPSVSYPIIDLSEMSYIPPEMAYLPPYVSQAPPEMSYVPPYVSPATLGPATPPQPLQPLPTAHVGKNAAEVETKNEVEEKLLKELEEMGFKQIDLNKEVLRLNEYDLEQAVDDLCDVAEWDPILEELHEMVSPSTILINGNN